MRFPEAGGIGWNVPEHPSVPPEALALNTRAVTTVMRFAGIGGLQINAHTGEQPEYEQRSRILGINLDNGVGSLLGTTTAKMRRNGPTLTVEETDGSEPVANLASKMTISLNRAEVGADMGTRRPGITPEDALAKALSRQIKSGLVDAVTRGVIAFGIHHEDAANRHGIDMATDMAILGALGCTLTAVSFQDMPSAIIGVMAYSGGYVGSLTYQYRQLRETGDASSWWRRHWSVFPTSMTPLDRQAFAAVRLVAAGQLVRPIAPGSRA